MGAEPDTQGTVTGGVVRRIGGFIMAGWFSALSQAKRTALVVGGIAVTGATAYKLTQGGDDKPKAEEAPPADGTTVPNDAAGGAGVLSDPGTSSYGVGGEPGYGATGSGQATGGADQLGQQPATTAPQAGAPVGSADAATLAEYDSIAKQLFTQAAPVPAATPEQIQQLSQQVATAFPETTKAVTSADGAQSSTVATVLAQSTLATPEGAATSIDRYKQLREALPELIQSNPVAGAQVAVTTVPLQSVLAEASRIAPTMTGQAQGDILLAAARNVVASTGSATAAGSSSGTSGAPGTKAATGATANQTAQLAAAIAQITKSYPETARSLTLSSGTMTVAEVLAKSSMADPGSMDSPFARYGAYRERYTAAISADPVAGLKVALSTASLVAIDTAAIAIGRTAAAGTSLDAIVTQAIATAEAQAPAMGAAPSGTNTIAA